MPVVSPAFVFLSRIASELVSDFTSRKDAGDVDVQLEFEHALNALLARVCNDDLPRGLMDIAIGDDIAAKKYLASVGWNAVRKARRREQNEHKHLRTYAARLQEQPWRAQSPTEFGTEDASACEERALATVLAVLEPALGRRDAELLRALHSASLSQSDAAEALGKSPNAMHVALHRIRARLHDQGITFASASRAVEGVA